MGSESNFIIRLRATAVFLRTPDRVQSCIKCNEPMKFDSDPVWAGV